MKPLFVIMVSHRRLEHLRRTIESLVPTLPEGSMLGIHDNASDPETRKYLNELTESWRNDKVKLRVVLHGENRGWGWAMNYSLTAGYFAEWRGYEYVLESNNDIEYEPDWFGRATTFMGTFPEIGILGLWKHPHHGVREERAGGLLIKDNMPACAWLFRSKDLQEFLPFKEKGACKTRGGNGEDTDMVLTVQGKKRWVCGLKEDLARHMDGYDLPDLGKENPAYL